MPKCVNRVQGDVSVTEHGVFFLEDGFRETDVVYSLSLSGQRGDDRLGAVCACGE
jgi:hypothetical protein